MATTKIWKVQKRLDKVINYATNEEKDTPFSALKQSSPVL